MIHPLMKYNFLHKRVQVKRQLWGGVIAVSNCNKLTTTKVIDIYFLIRLSRTIEMFHNSRLIT